MTVDELRKDLLDIRYYYSRKAMFDRAADCVAKNAAIALAERYNGVIWNAPPRLYDVYASLYVRGFTQEALAAELNFSVEYIQMLNVRLVKFLQTRIEE